MSHNWAEKIADGPIPVQIKAKRPNYDVFHLAQDISYMRSDWMKQIVEVVHEIRGKRYGNQWCILITGLCEEYVKWVYCQFVEVSHYITSGKR